MIEEWRQIEGFSDYEISNFGKVRTWRRQTSSKNPRNQPVLLKGSPDTKGGYWRVKIRDDEGNPKTVKVHVLVCCAWHGPRPNGKIVRHLDGNPQNNREDNLRWGTHLENSADAKVHGTWLHGTQVNHAKLNDETVLDILQDRRTSYELADVYNVSSGCIQHIRQGRTWKHVEVSA